MLDYAHIQFRQPHSIRVCLYACPQGSQSEAEQNRCRVKRRREGDIVNVDESDLDENGSPSPHPSRPGRTPSGRMDRKNNPLNKMFGSRYRNPENTKVLMGELMPLGKAFAIIAVMTHGPDLPTEISLHNERHRIFMAAAQYALSEADIKAVLDHPVAEDKRTYYHNLLASSCRPLNTLLYNEARDFFQDEVFGCAQHNAEYKLHLGLSVEESVFDA